MEKTDHPRGLNPDEREEWHKLCDRLLELYNKMPMGDTKRKIIAGGDEKGLGSILFFLIGTCDDAFKIRDLINEMDKHQD